MKKKVYLLFLLFALLLVSLPVSSLAAQASSPTKKVGWVQKKYRYYYDKSGHMKKNTLCKISGKRYYFNKNGHMLKNAWKTINKKTYYFTQDGSAAAGPTVIKKKTYLFYKSNFLMRQGLRTWNGKTYYLNKSGIIQTGWQKIKTKWYYFNKNGTMKTGWLTDKKQVYYLNSKGIMLTGWQKIKVKKTTYSFYFYPDGRRAKSTWIDGKYLNSLGRCIPGKTKPLTDLKNSLNTYIANSCTSGIWSVYVKDLSTGESFSTSQNQLYAASVIKAFTMGAVYESIKSGTLSESDYINQLLYNMITFSDNGSFNALVSTIGLNATNSFLNKYHYVNTSQGQGFDGAGLDNGTGYNRTTAEDCGRLLEDIYTGKCVNKAYSNKMLSLLKQQTRKNKIPSGVPSGTVYNKTGETDEYEHDMAIVESPKTTYIICVMSHISNPGAAQGNIRTMSNMVYQYFNK